VHNIVIWSIFLTLSLPVAVEAQTLQCNGGVISLGDAKSEILLKCGEPLTRDTCEETRMGKNNAGKTLTTTILVDTWTYFFESDSLFRIFRFENDKLTGIKTGNSGC
jgi:hypothetical protein